LGSICLEILRLQCPFAQKIDPFRNGGPDLKQFVLSTLCVDRAVPIWGKPEDGNASDKRINTTILSEISQIMGRYGVAPGAYIYIADSAMVTETNLASLGETLFISRLPATYSACARVIEAAVSAESWHEGGGAPYASS
jgi:transposase